MPRTKAKSARNLSFHDQVLVSALHLFSSAGYFNTSIHDIQRAADVSMGSIYNYFAGKEAIAKALYHKLLDQMESVVDHATESHDSAYAQGKEMVSAMFEMTETDPEMIGFILNARHREFLTDEPAICSSKPFVKLRDIVIQGMKNGEIRDMEPWLAASLVFGPALRMIVLRLDGMIEKPLPESLDELWELTWGGIKATTP